MTEICLMKRLSYVVGMPIIAGIIGIIVSFFLAIVNIFVGILGYELWFFDSMINTIIGFVIIGIVMGLVILLFPNSEFTKNMISSDDTTNEDI